MANPLNKSALVSVVIPCHNSDGTILRAFESILNQSLLPKEVIFIDDASSDSTPAFLSNWKKQYGDWVKVVILPSNQGAGSARNAGWDTATQPYIAFLDADDAWHPRKLEIQYNYMVKNPEIVLSGHGYNLISKGSGLPSWEVGQWKAVFVSRIKLVLSNQFITPSIMLKRLITERFVLGQRHMEDHRLWLNLAFGGAQIVKLSAPLAAIYKLPYGEAGLSNQLFLMERADIANIQYLYKCNYINRIQCLALIIYSIMKYLRRLFVSWILLRMKRG